MINIWQNINPLFGKSNTLHEPSVYKNQLGVIDYIYSQAQGKQFKYTLYTPPVNDYTYTYLFDWYGKNRYGYTPQNTAKLFFLILEPDRENPKRLTDWLTIRKNDGVIQTQKTLPGDIIIQTRITK